MSPPGLRSVPVPADIGQEPGYILHHGAHGEHGVVSGKNSISVFSVPSVVQSFWLYDRRSLKRWIFPVAVFGSASTNSTQRGYLNGARRSLTKRCSSSEVARAPGFRTTKALGLSSWFSSLCATTAASSTDGCATRADSTSAGDTHWPPALIM